MEDECWIIKLINSAFLLCGKALGYVLGDSGFILKSDLQWV